MWSATTALPLGLLNDLLAGHPIGQSMALWTITFLAFDLLDSRVLFRDYWMDWFFAALAILFYVWSGWLIGQLMGSSVAFAVMAPQLGASVLAFRSEEHTSELQSLMRISYAVFCLKKKNITN